jgi:hypothetical protein
LKAAIGNWLDTLRRRVVFEWGRKLYSESGVKIQEWLVSLSAQDFLYAVNQIFWWLVLVSVLGMLLKVKAIAEIIKGINEARSPIWDLRGTVNQLHTLEPVISDLKALEPLIRQLGEQVPLLYEKVDTAQRQLTELQLENASSRTDGTRDEVDADADGRTTQVVETEDHWEELREYWFRNAKRLEYVIEKIPDGRTRLSFDRMSRRNLKTIIKKLEDADFIDAASANASLRLVDEFNRHRPRHKVVPAEVVGPLQNLDKQLDDAIVQFAQIEGTDAPAATQPRSPNQSGGFYPSPNGSSEKPTGNSVVHQRR